MTVDRRTLLAGASAALAVSFAPPVVLAAPAAVPQAPMPAWSVGTPGEWDWRAVVAADAHEARIAWMGEDGTDGVCEDGGPFRAGCRCGECRRYHGLDVTREPTWDGHDVKAGDAHWHASGLGSRCVRCDAECYPDDGSAYLGVGVVCDVCVAPGEEALAA